MPKTCDNKSVGQIIFKGKDLLMIERKNYPKSYALPAGHSDGDTFDIAARRETKEEVWINILQNQRVWRGTLQNQCKCENGSYHEWQIFRATTWTGAPKAGDDAKSFFWAPPEHLQALAVRTEYFIKKYKIPYSDISNLIKAIFGSPKQKNTDPEWIKEMGLEPAWYLILKELNII